MALNSPSGFCSDLFQLRKVGNGKLKLDSVSNDVGASMVESLILDILISRSCFNRC